MAKATSRTARASLRAETTEPSPPVQAPAVSEPEQPPGDGPPATPPPTDEELELGGVTLRLPAADAQKLRDYDLQQRTRVADAYDRVRSTFVARVAPPLVPPPDEAAAMALPDHALMVTDPERYTRELDQAIRRALQSTRQQTLAEIEAQRARDQQSADQQRRVQLLRDGFYEAHPAFKGAEMVVDPIMGRKWQEFVDTGRVQQMTVADGWKEIAAESELAILKIQRLNQPAGTSPKPPQLEGSAPRRPTTPAPETPPPSRQSLSDGIRKLKEKHGQRRYSALRAAQG